MNMSREDEEVIWSKIMYRDLVIQYLFVSVIDGGGKHLNLSTVYDKPFRLKKAYAASLCILFVASTAA